MVTGLNYQFRHYFLTKGERMSKKNTWKNQMKKSRTALKMFCKFLSKQDRLVYAKDMFEGWTHTYMISTNGIDTDRCILWAGVKSDMLIMKDLIDRDKYDAQLNIEVQPFASENGCFVYIAQHKIGMRLDNIESWDWDHE